MLLRIVAVGKIKEAHIKEGVDDYLARIKRYHRVEVKEVKESSHDGEPGWEEEGVKLAKVLDPAAFTTVLTPEGTCITTMELAQKLESLMGRGYRSLDFVIGGHAGLDPAIKKKADFALSLSSLTFPYQLSRLMLAEQIYRCLKIMRGEKYHR